MYLLLVAASIAHPNLPDRHFYDAELAVDTVSTCLDAPLPELENLRSKLAQLERRATRAGLGAEIERQRRELKYFYMSSLRIRCGGGKAAKAFRNASAALRSLERFINTRDRL